MVEYNIRLIANQEMISILPLVQTLNPEIAMSVLEIRLTEMMNQNYNCIGIYDSGNLIGICGLWILYKFYVGKHLEVDNVVVDKRYQGKGLGSRLIEWAIDYGKQENCAFCELNCYINNTKAIQFWENLGFKKLGFHMQKTII